MKRHTDCYFSSIIAEEFGIPAALVLNRIMWSIETHENRNQNDFFVNNRWWMYDTAKSFQAEFDFLSLSTIERAIKSLEQSGLIDSLKMGQKEWDRTKWYSINEYEYQRRISAYFSMSSKCGDHDQQNEGMRSRHDEVIEPVKMTNSSSSMSQTINPTMDQSKTLKNSKAAQAAPASGGLVKSLQQIPMLQNEHFFLPPNEQKMVLNSIEAHEVTPKMTVRSERSKMAIIDPQDHEVAIAWRNWALEKMPWQIKAKCWNLEPLAIQFGKIRKEIGISPEGLMAMLEFVKMDKFWEKVALSPYRLLSCTGNDKSMRKIDNLLNAMRCSKQYREAKVANVTEEQLEEFRRNSPF